MVMNKLLEIAKTSSPRQKLVITNDHIELALAWLRKEVTTTGVGKALGVKSDQAGAPTLYKVASILRYAYSVGILKIR